MADAFVVFVKALSVLYGKPKRLRRKEFVASQWDVSNGCRVKVMSHYSVVGVCVYSPSYGQVLRNSEWR